MAAPDSSWFSSTTAALTTSAGGLLAFLLALAGYLRSGRREKRDDAAKEKVEAAERIVADRDFFAKNYRDIIDELRKERGRLSRDLHEMRVQSIAAAAECDRRITELEKGARADAVMIKNLQDQNRLQARQIATLENRERL